MKRLFTMFMIAAVFTVAMVFSGCESARAAPAAEIAAIDADASDTVLQLSKETPIFQQVTPFSAYDSGLRVSNAMTRSDKAIVPSYFVAGVRQIEAKLPDRRIYYARIEARPKIFGFNGIGHNHFARADV